MLRALAYAISVIFHPLLVVCYMLLILLWASPTAFGVTNPTDKDAIVLLMRTFFSTFLIPFIAILMMKGLGLIKSVEMEDRYDRIAPFLVIGTFYLWHFKNMQNSTTVSPAFTAGLLGAILGLFTSFAINMFFKISLHTLGMGGLVAFIGLSFQKLQLKGMTIANHFLDLNTLMLIALIFSGIVLTSRLILKAHQVSEVIAGLVLGALAQYVAFEYIF